MAFLSLNRICQPLAQRPAAEGPVHRTKWPCLKTGGLLSCRVPGPGSCLECDTGHSQGQWLGGKEACAIVKDRDSSTPIKQSTHQERIRREQKRRRLFRGNKPPRAAQDALLQWSQKPPGWGHQIKSPGLVGRVWGTAKLATVRSSYARSESTPGVWPAAWARTATAHSSPCPIYPGTKGPLCPQTGARQPLLGLPTPCWPSLATACSPGRSRRTIHSSPRRQPPLRPHTCWNPLSLLHPHP